ncbi:MAG TPA: type IV pilin protein [Ramlibacter sp.]|nr:type IV pilin protein [Ramlibacter sp.]
MRKKRYAGFTLIELMIAVAIIAIVVRLAYGQYTSQFTRAKRSAVESFMVQVAAREEQAMLNSRAYFAIAAGTVAQWSAVNITVPAEVGSNYTVTVAANNAATPPSYTITATPQGKQASNDTTCGVLTYNQAQTKTAAGSGGVANCWR